MSITSLIKGQNNKYSSVRVSFLLWMVALSLTWGIISFKDGKLADIPATVVHITLTLGVTKVTHRVAEGNFDKIVDTFNAIVRSRFIKKKPVKGIKHKKRA